MSTRLFQWKVKFVNETSYWEINDDKKAEEEINDERG